MKADIQEACDYFYSKRDELKFVFLLGHWNKQGAGTRPGNDVVSLQNHMAANFTGCQWFDQRKKFKFLTGHEHCNHVKQQGRGFLLGSFGMDDFDCPDSPAYNTTHTYGIPVVTTTDAGAMQVYYFRLMSEHEDRYDEVMRCIKAEGTWRKCTQYAELWLDQPADVGSESEELQNLQNFDKEVLEAVFA